MLSFRHPKNPPHDLLYQNKEENHEEKRHGLQETEAPAQARDQGKVRTMVERSLEMTAMPQDRAASPDWSIQSKKRRVTRSPSYAYPY